MESFYYERPVVCKLFLGIFESQYCWNYKCILSEFSSVDLTLNKEYVASELACETQFSAAAKDMYF